MCESPPMTGGFATIDLLTIRELMNRVKGKLSHLLGLANALKRVMQFSCAAMFLVMCCVYVTTFWKPIDITGTLGRFQLFHLTIFNGVFFAFHESATSENAIQHALGRVEVAASKPIMRPSLNAQIEYSLSWRNPMEDVVGDLSLTYDGPLIPPVEHYSAWLTSASFPLWPVLLALALPTVPYCRYLLQQARYRRMGLCLECGYDISGGDTNRCPECGTRIPDKQIEAIT
jgi:hypothetical protein